MIFAQGVEERPHAADPNLTTYRQSMPKAGLTAPKRKTTITLSSKFRVEKLPEGWKESRNSRD
jgi:hypothetical protein